MEYHIVDLVGFYWDNSVINTQKDFIWTIQLL